MSTISQNNIVVNYVITSDQIAKTKTEFDKLTDAEKKAVDETKKLNDSLKKTGQEGGQSVKNVGNEMNNLSGIVKSGAGLLAGFFAVSKIQEFTKKLFTTTAAFESLRTTIDYATQGQVKSGEAFQYLTNLANKYGKDLQSLAGVYSSFTASSNLAGIKLNESNKIFEAAVKASTALGKSNQDTQGILLAFSQIVSKGTVQAEELRGQIGERIPGAFNLAAKAMGVTTRELNKMLEQGQVISAEFLPKFAVELENAFGSAAEAKINSMAASLGRFTTAWDKFLESPLIGKYLAETLNLFTVTLNEIRKLTMTEGEKKADDEARIESNITNNLKNELAARLKVVQESTNKNATMDQIALQKYTETLAYRDKLLDKTVNLRIQSAGSMNKVALNEAENQLKYTNIVLDALEKEVNGYTITQKKKAELTDAELKALKAQYDAKLKLLELDKRIADINIQLSTEEGPERDIKLLQNAEEFGKKKLEIDRYYAGLGLKDAQENAKLQVFIVRKQADDIIVEIKKQAKAGADQTSEIKKQLEKQIQDNDDYESKKQLARKESEKNQKEHLQELKRLEKEKADEIKKIDKKSADEKKKFEDDIKEIEKQENEAIAYALGEFSDMITTRRLDNINREYNAMQRKYNEEVRLADGNVQKITELDEKRKAKEKELREKEFYAQQQNAIAQVIFKTAPIIAEYFATGVLAPAAIAALYVQSAQIGFILSQPVPEFAEGTKGKKYKGRAIVGEQGTEKVVTQSGRVYYTPPVATLAQFDEPVEIIPNHQLGLNDRKQLSLIYGNRSSTSDSGGKIIEKLSNIEIGLKNMPVAAISLDERGFMKKVRTPNRSTTILNNRFKN